jgi:hypothetical protein
VVTVLATAAWLQAGGAPPVRRAAPPAAWDEAIVATFPADAFAALEGPRPDFAALRAAEAATGDASATGRSGSGPFDASGFKWSALVSEETLTDEIKDMKAVAATAAARATEFKGGGYERARDAFSVVAVSFAVIAAYDQDIRWRRDAAVARDLFARAGFNCKAGTDQSFAESQARVADLEAMLDGGAPAGKPDRDEDFQWSQTASRSALMSRLETADGRLAAAVADKAEFAKQIETVAHDAEIVAVIGEVIQQRDFEGHDDETYRGYAAAMRDAGLAARDAARKKDHAAALAAVDAMKKACAACHGDYR